MLYREIIAVCSEIHAKHINALWAEPKGGKNQQISVCGETKDKVCSFVCRWEFYVILLWTAFLLRSRFDRVIYIPGKTVRQCLELHHSRNTYIPSFSSALIPSHSLSRSVMFFFLQYRSLTSTPVMDKSEDPSLYREHESCLTLGMNTECWFEHFPTYLTVLVRSLNLLKLFVKWTKVVFSQQYRNNFFFL